MNLQVTEKKVDGVERLLQVEVPADMVRQAEEKAVRRYASSARLPGFRPGKAPPAMIAAFRGRDPTGSGRDADSGGVQAGGWSDVKLAAQPHVHEVKFRKASRSRSSCTSKCVRRSSSRARKASASRAAGDRHRRERSGTDRAMREQRARGPRRGQARRQRHGRGLLATAEEDGNDPRRREYRIVLGGGQAIAGIEELIMTLKPGETPSVPCGGRRISPTRHSGQDQDGARHAADVKRKSLPDARRRVRARNRRLRVARTRCKAPSARISRPRRTREADADVRQKLIDEIIDANPFDVPPAWVNQMVDGYIEAYQVPETERERFAQRFRPMAERQVRRDLIDRHAVRARKARRDRE